MYCSYFFFFVDISEHLVFDCNDPAHGVKPGDIAFACDGSAKTECHPFFDIYSNGPDCMPACSNLKDEGTVYIGKVD